LVTVVDSISFQLPITQLPISVRVQIVLKVLDLIVQVAHLCGRYVVAQTAGACAYCVVD